MFAPCRCLSRLGSIVLFSSRYLSTTTTTTSSVDNDELNRFRRLSSTWWNESGEYAALHSLNQLRVPFIREQLGQSSSSKMLNDPRKPLTGFKLLDVGCGGGILTEPLARLGASVLGIDAVLENISTARLHADASLAKNLDYQHVTLEELCNNIEEQNQYDALIASELIEHINDVDTFIGNTHKLIKPGGLCFITTLNRTIASFALGIVAAEYILRVLPQGTHSWNKFINPSDLSVLFDKNGFSVIILNGMSYNPLTNRWSWSKTKAINYAICAQKL